MHRRCRVHLAQLATWLEEGLVYEQVSFFSFSPHEDVENGELGHRDLVDQPGDQIVWMLGPRMGRKPPFSIHAPANHGEGGGGEVELGPGEATDTAKWY